MTHELSHLVAGQRARHRRHEQMGGDAVLPDWLEGFDLGPLLPEIVPDPTVQVAGKGDDGFWWK
eukprot:2771698-Rhodomonas_salina.1